MKSNKFEFISKRKKEVVIILAITGLIVLGAIGYAFGFNSDKDVNVTSNGVEVVEKTEAEEKKEVKVNNEEESKKESEELKNTDTYKISEEEKKDAEVLTNNEEIKDNSTTSSSATSSSVTDSSSEEANTSEEASTSESEKSAYEKEAEEMARAFPSASTKVMKENFTKNPMSIYKERTHYHSWVDVTETITHAEEGHWEEVVVTPESVKEVPVYETKASEICNGCGAIDYENIYD